MALPTKLTLEVVTPERRLVSEQVDEVQLPGAEGYFGVLPGQMGISWQAHLGGFIAGALAARSYRARP